MASEGEESSQNESTDSLLYNIALSHLLSKNPRNVRVPTFYKNNPRLWFVQLEASFRINSVTDDSQRFDWVISNLEADIASLVEDLILAPPDSNRYDSLKTKLLDLFSETADRRLKHQQQDGEDTKMKPSDVLAHMRSISSVPGNDEVIRMLFIGQLPQSIRPLMSVWQEDNLEMLAKTADKMLEAFNTNQAFMLPLTSVKANSDQLAEFSGAIMKIKEELSKFGKARSRSPYRSRLDRGLRKSKCGATLCYYHSIFGSKAVNCRRGCARWLEQRSSRTGTQPQLDHTTVA